MFSSPPGDGQISRMSLMDEELLEEGDLDIVEDDGPGSGLSSPERENDYLDHQIRYGCSNGTQTCVWDFVLASIGLELDPVHKQCQVNFNELELQFQVN